MNRIARDLRASEAEVLRPVVEGGILPDLLSFALARATAVGETSFHDAVGDKSVTRLRYSMLEVVASAPGLNQVQIADALSLSRSGVTHLADYWESRGLIERRRSTKDRRSFGIHLSKAGESYLDDLRERVVAHDRSLSAPLNERERATLNDLLGKLLSPYEPLK